MYDAASTILAQKLSQVHGVGQVTVGGSSLPAVRVELNPQTLNKYGIGLETVRTALASANANRPKGMVEEGDRNWQIYANDQAKTAAEYLPLIVAYRNGAAVRLGDVAEVVDSVQNIRNAGYVQRQALGAGDHQPPAQRQHHRHRRPRHRVAAQSARVDSGRDRSRAGNGAHRHHPRVAARCRTDAVDLGGAGDPGRLPVPAELARHVDPGHGGSGVAGRHVRGDVLVRLQPGQSVADGADHRHRFCRR